MNTPSDANALFDLADEYDEMLARGLKLSGENREFFMVGRVEALVELLDDPAAIHRVLDFGCGTGETTRYLGDVFPHAEVVGVDTAPGALGYARREHGGPRTTFALLDAVEPESFDLCYVNGVFHHILPGERGGALRFIHDALLPGGWFAFFENNPWNLGTRLIMSRVSFDKDAILLSPIEARSQLRSAGFETALPTRYLFFFPRVLRVLRPLEPSLARVPLGGQYLTLARKAPA